MAFGIDILQTNEEEISYVDSHLTHSNKQRSSKKFHMDLYFIGMPIELFCDAYFVLPREKVGGGIFLRLILFDNTWTYMEMVLMVVSSLSINFK